MLILTITENLHELLKNRGLTTIAALCEFGRVVVMTVNTAFVLVVTVGCAKDCGANRACEMFDVVFAVEGSNVGASESLAAFETEEIKPAKVICLA